jgi:hypothetical protein
VEEEVCAARAPAALPAEEVEGEAGAVEAEVGAAALLEAEVGAVGVEAVAEAVGVEAVGSGSDVLAPVLP